MPVADAIVRGRAPVRRGGLNQAQLVNVLKALRDKAVFTTATLLGVGSTNTQLAYGAFVYSVAGVAYPLVSALAAGVALTAQGLVNTSTGQVCKIRVEVRDVSGTPTLSFVQSGFYAAQALAPVPPRTPGRATLGVLEIPASYTFGTTPLTAGMISSGDPDLNLASLEA